MPDKSALFDSDFALTQFSGNKEMLLSILLKFIKQYQDFSANLLENETVGEYEQIKVDVHTIKGVAGNLGMKALFTASREFENVIDDRRPNQEQIQTYTAVLTNTFATIAKYQGNNQKKAAEKRETIRDDQSAKSLLLKALSRNEFITEHKLELWLNELALSSASAEELAKAIDDLDYEQAIKLIG